MLRWRSGIKCRRARWLQERPCPNVASTRRLRHADFGYISWDIYFRVLQYFVFFLALHFSTTGINMLRRISSCGTACFKRTESSSVQFDGSFSGELWLRLCRLAQIGDEKSLPGGKRMAVRYRMAVCSPIPLMECLSANERQIVFKLVRAYERVPTCQNTIVC